MNTESTNQFTSGQNEACDNTQDKPMSDKEQILTSANWQNKLPLLLRWIGGITLITSAFIFLLSGWIDAEPLYRYYSFFGFTAILAGAGIFCGSRLKEDKGARTFLALCASFIPAHFCQLGAIAYAEYNGAASDFSPHYQLLQFDPIGPQLLVATLIGAGILLPIFAFIGFSAMARSSAKQLTITYIISNTLLLIPTRESNTVAIIGFVLLLFLIGTEIKFFSKKAALKNWDGIAMRALLFAPFGLILGRNLILHDASHLITSLFHISAFGVLFIGLPNCTPKLKLKAASQHLGLIPLFLAWISLLEAASINVSAGSFTLFLGIPFAIIVTTTSFYSYGWSKSYRKLAAIIALSTSIIELIAVGGIQISIITLILSICVTISSFFMKEKALLFMGVCGTAISILHHIHYAIELYQQNLWISLALTGTVAILISSYIERNWKQVIDQSRIIRGKLHAWN